MTRPLAVQQAARPGGTTRRWSGIYAPHVPARSVTFIGQNGVSRKTTLLHATLYLVLGFRHLSNVRKHQSNYHGYSEEVVQSERSVRPIDSNNIKGVTIVTRAGPFRPPLIEHSGMGTSQPCVMHKTETAAMAIQPPGATWRHYNPERGERVVRKAVLARCGVQDAQTRRQENPTAAQHSRR